MRVVFDTNVVVSAVLKDRVPEEIILFVVSHPDFEWVASQEIIDEYLAVLRRPKFKLPEQTIEKWAEMFRSVIAQVPVDAEIPFPRDLADAKFVACGVSAQADFLITGDRDFDEACRIMLTTVMSVSAFRQFIAEDGLI